MSYYIGDEDKCDNDWSYQQEIVSTSDKQPGSSKSANVSTNISVINRQLNVRPFQTTQNRTETATRWEKWLKDIERQFRYFGITEPETKKDGLMIYGGQIKADLEDSLPDLTGDEAGQDVYAQLINKLNKHFLLKKNKDLARFQFGNLNQNDRETLAHYYTRIKEIARKCGFSSETEVFKNSWTMTSWKKSLIKTQ